jgi:4'-phosphopantetheinyl transferase EntD
MHAHFRRTPREERPASCWVALLESQSLLGTGRDYRIYLSAAERNRHGALRSSKRRLEWLAGRLAAKYAFLHRLERGVVDDAEEWCPTLLQLSAQSLDAFPLWMYQRIELPASTDPERGGPRLRWCGKSNEEAVSLSHTGNNACACLCAEGTVGIDIETVAPRVEAFYRWNYTEREKLWVSLGANLEPLSREWLFTLLWTLKEAALKARAVLQKSPWSFAGVGVSGLPAPEDVLWAYRNRTWGEKFGLFEGVIEEDCNATRVQVAYLGTRHLVLTVVRPFGP